MYVSMYTCMYTCMYIHMYEKPVPEKMRLEMVIAMQNKIQIGIKKISLWVSFQISNEKRPTTIVSWFRFGFRFAFWWPFRVSPLTNGLYVCIPFCLCPSLIFVFSTLHSFRGTLTIKFRALWSSNSCNCPGLTTPHRLNHSFLPIDIHVCVCVRTCVCVLYIQYISNWECSNFQKF